MNKQYNFEKIADSVLIEAQNYIDAFAKTENNKNIICFCIIYHLPSRIEYSFLDEPNKKTIEDVNLYPFNSEEQEISKLSFELYEQLQKYRTFTSELCDLLYDQNREEFDKWTLLNTENYQNMLLEVIRKLDFSNIDKHPKFVFMVNSLTLSYSSWNDTVPKEWEDFYFE